MELACLSKGADGAILEINCLQRLLISCSGRLLFAHITLLLIYVTLVKSPSISKATLSLISKKMLPEKGGKFISKEDYCRQSPVIQHIALLAAAVFDHKSFERNGCY